MKVLEGTFKGYKEVTLYYRYWLPDGHPKAVILFCHGATIHSGFYSNLAAYLSERSFAVYAPDLRGHGKSEGQRCYLDRFDDYLLDLRKFIKHVDQEQQDRKMFLVGHSMGGYIAGFYASRYKDEVAGLVMASTGTIGSTLGVPKVLIAMAGISSALTPRLGINYLPEEGFSRDKTIMTAFKHDPLVYHGRLPARWGAEMLKMLKELPSRVTEIKAPVLIMHGSCDSFNVPEGSSILLDLVSSKDKTLKLYEGLYHDIFNEPEKEMVMNDLLIWLNARV